MGDPIFELLLRNRLIVVKIEHALDVLVVLLDFCLILDVLIETLHDVCFNFGLDEKRHGISTVGPAIWTVRKTKRARCWAREAHKS